MNFRSAMKLKNVALVISLVAGICLVSTTILGCQKGDVTWKAGDKVDVDWKGTWWKADVVEATSEGKYKIHYVGWSTRWDETVPSTRVRARTAGAKEGSGTKEKVKKPEPKKTVAVKPKPIKPPPVAPATTKPPATTGAPATAWKVSDKVDVEWNGAWWKGEILEVASGKYKIHYVGWAASWDETVPGKRLRARTKGSKQGTAK